MAEPHPLPSFFFSRHHQADRALLCVQASLVPSFLQFLFLTSRLSSASAADARPLPCLRTVLPNVGPILGPCTKLPARLPPFAGPLSHPVLPTVRLAGLPACLLPAWAMFHIRAASGCLRTGIFAQAPSRLTPCPLTAELRCSPRGNSSRRLLLSQPAFPNALGAYAALFSSARGLTLPRTTLKQ